MTKEKGKMGRGSEQEEERRVSTGKRDVQSARAEAREVSGARTAWSEQE